MDRNYEININAFKRLEENPGEKSVFSIDGFIEWQAGMQDVKFGKVTAAYGGCGAIATWNILKAFGFDSDKALHFKEMEKGAIFGGKLGTGIFFIKKYLKNKGHQVDMYFSFKEFKKAFSRIGIVYYIKDNFKAHFVAFTPAGVNERGEFIYRFHNANAGAYWKNFDGIKHIENLPMTMEDFLKESNAKVKVFYDVRK